MKINGIGNSITIIMKIITFFGRETVWLAAIATFLFVYYWRAPFIAYGLSLVYGIGLIYVIKRIINRRRPFENKNLKVILREKIGRSSSFPSWHTYNIVSQVFTTYFIFHNQILLIIGFLFTLILAFSRVYLGVHYPTDVIVGFLFGILGFIITLLTFNWWVSLLNIVEEFAGFGGQQDQVFNQFFNHPWYILIVIVVYAGIIFASLYKYIFYRKLFLK
ncbi:MAG: phosphatase PAP2 family protein [Candidatus Thorarchaeota archaeon]